MKLIYRLSLILILSIQVGCSDGSSVERAVIYQPVSVVRLQEQSEFSITRSYTGVVQPAQTANIAFEFPGTVKLALANEGDRVEERELLARLDTSLLDIERRQLQAQLAEAQANLRLSSSNLQRQSSLESDGYSSLQQRDELEASRDVFQANILSLEAALDGNLVRQEKSHLYAPFAGVISERYLEEGSASAPGVPAFRVLETGQLEAHVGVPRKLAAQIAPGDTVILRVDEQELTGEVLAVGGELKARSHAVMIRILLPDSASLTGSVAELQLQDSIEADGFIIPESALTASIRGLWRVYVASPAEEGLYRVEARDLQLRYSGESFSYVTGGVRDGESIVVDGLHKIVPGQLVRVSTSG
jgi:RND family efflux transporter MFP subunit